MIALRADLKVVLAAQPVDFRKSVHTLSALVSEALHANPYCGDVFVFRSKRTAEHEDVAAYGFACSASLHQRRQRLHRFATPPLRSGATLGSARSADRRSASERRQHRRERRHRHSRLDPDARPARLDLDRPKTFPGGDAFSGSLVCAGGARSSSLAVPRLLSSASIWTGTKLRTLPRAACESVPPGRIEQPTRATPLRRATSEMFASVSKLLRDDPGLLLRLSIVVAGSAR